jgi:SAM-dependent methyltransferase
VAAGLSRDAARWDEAAARAIGRPYLDPQVAAAKRRAHLDLLDRWLPDLEGQVVLKTDLWEEGVAGDELLFALAARSGEAHGMDVSPMVVARAGEGAADAPVSLRCADVRSLPWPDASFDAVVSTSTLDHLETVPEHRRAIEEIHRVLRPGGSLAITFDNAQNMGDSLLRAAARLRAVPFPLGPGVSREQLEDLLSSSGFEIVDHAYLVPAPRVAATAAVRLLRLLPSAASDRAVGALLRRFDALGERFPRRMACFVGVLARRSG